MRRSVCQAKGIRTNSNKPLWHIKAVFYLSIVSTESDKIHFLSLRWKIWKYPASNKKFHRPWVKDNDLYWIRGLICGNLRRTGGYRLVWIPRVTSEANGEQEGWIIPWASISSTDLDIACLLMSGVLYAH